LTTRWPALSRPTNAREAAPTGLFHSNFTRRDPVDLGRKQAEVNVQRLSRSGSQFKAKDSLGVSPENRSNRTASHRLEPARHPAATLHLPSDTAGRELIGRKTGNDCVVQRSFCAGVDERRSGEMPYRKWWRFESDDDVFTIMGILPCLMMLALVFFQK
jgi:hypothetical protein